MATVAPPPAVQPISLSQSASAFAGPQRQSGFQVSAMSPRSDGSNEMPHGSGGISPHLLHSPNAASPEFRMLLNSQQGSYYDVGNTQHAMQHLDLMGGHLGGPSLHMRSNSAGSVGSFAHTVPRYFVAPQHSASPHEIFSPRPESSAGANGASVADDLASSLDGANVMGHRRQGSTGKVPSAAVQARQARRFSVSSAGTPPATKATETSPNGGLRWFDQHAPTDGLQTPGGESDFGGSNHWASPLPTAAIDMSQVQTNSVHHRGFMPSSAPASSTSFTLGRAPGGRLRGSDPVIPSNLSEVNEEDHMHTGINGAPPTDKRRKRRESHNLVERRRRDHINQAISDLSRLVPAVMLEPAPGATGLTHHHVHNQSIIAASPTFAVDEFGSPTAGGAVLKPNKGLILERSVDYIRLLQQQSATLSANCAALKEAVIRLGGDPDGALAASTENGSGISPHILHRRHSSNVSESSGDPLGGIDIEAAMGQGPSDYMDQ